MINIDPKNVAYSSPKNHNLFLNVQYNELYLPDLVTGTYCRRPTEISGSDRLMLNRFGGFIRFFRTSMPRRHLMQAFPHFGLAAIRATF